MEIKESAGCVRASTYDEGVPYRIEISVDKHNSQTVVIDHTDLADLEYVVQKLMKRLRAIACNNKVRSEI